MERGAAPVFNHAVWRTFGNDSFAGLAGFLDLKDWGPVEQAALLETALGHWRSGGHCFTDAYCPARLGKNIELRARKSSDEEDVAKAYTEVLVGLSHIWKARLHIVDTAVEADYREADEG